MFQLEMSILYRIYNNMRYNMSIENNFHMSHTTFVLGFHISHWDKILS